MTSQSANLFETSRRKFMRQAGAFSLASFISACSNAAINAAVSDLSKPNFLFLPIDDLNDWIGILGTNANVKTPNIDALAERGMLFKNAHAQAPICSPSRASLMSGLYPHQTGLYGQMPDNKLRVAIQAVSPTPFLPEYLKEGGYYTAGRGKLFHQGAPEGSFDEYFREGDFGPKPPQRMKWNSSKTHTDWGAYPDTNADMIDYQTARWGEKWLYKNHEKSFFLGLGMIRPHVPWHVPKEWFDMYPLEDINLPPWLETDMDDIPSAGKKLTAVPQMPTIEWAIENKEWRPILQSYLASISFVDHCVGIAVDALRASAYADNTYIILFSDHGYHLGEKSRFAKMSLWGRSTRVPLIISGPDVRIGETDSAVGLVDLYPTIVELAGLPKNLENSGQSLVPHLRGVGQERRYITTEYGKDNFAVVNKDYRYIRYADGSEELYDLRSDPHEWNNLASDSKYTDIKHSLSQEIPSETRDTVKGEMYK